MSSLSQSVTIHISHEADEYWKGCPIVTNRWCWVSSGPGYGSFCANTLMWFLGVFVKIFSACLKILLVTHPPPVFFFSRALDIFSFLSHWPMIILVVPAGVRIKANGLLWHVAMTHSGLYVRETLSMLNPFPIPRTKRLRPPEDAW